MLPKYCNSFLEICPDHCGDRQGPTNFQQTVGTPPKRLAQIAQVTFATLTIWSPRQRQSDDWERIGYFLLVFVSLSSVKLVICPMLEKVSMATRGSHCPLQYLYFGWSPIWWCASDIRYGGVVRLREVFKEHCAPHILNLRYTHSVLRNFSRARWGNLYAARLYRGIAGLVARARHIQLAILTPKENIALLGNEGR